MRPAIKCLCQEVLRCSLFRKCLDAGLRKLETDEPHAGNTAAVDFGRSEFPAAGGFQGQIGEILAGAGRIESGFGDVAGGINLNANTDANRTGDGGACFFRDVRQNLVKDFAARGRSRGGLLRVRGREVIGAQSSGSGGWRAEGFLAWSRHLGRMR
jgi:hypothetical protein